jgi:hypothetical protein
MDGLNQERTRTLERQRVRHPARVLLVWVEIVRRTRRFSGCWRYHGWAAHETTCWDTLDPPFADLLGLRVEGGFLNGRTPF